MKITDTIRYAGVNDHQIDLFEGQYKVPNGMTYNSYVILDEKIAVMDTVDANFKFLSASPCPCTGTPAGDGGSSRHLPSVFAAGRRFSRTASGVHSSRG